MVPILRDMSHPLNSAAGYVPPSSKHAQAHPIVIEPVRQITDEELESQAEFVRLRNMLLRIDHVDNGVLNHRQTIHDAYHNVRKMKEKVHRLEAEFWGKDAVLRRSTSSSQSTSPSYHRR